MKVIRCRLKANVSLNGQFCQVDNYQRGNGYRFSPSDPAALPSNNAFINSKPGSAAQHSIDSRRMSWITLDDIAYSKLS